MMDFCSVPQTRLVVPAKAGTHNHSRRLSCATAARAAPSERVPGVWVPAFAGTTEWVRLMLGYLLRRVLAAIPVMGVVALFVFLLLRLTPGDPAAILAGDNATPEQLERIRISLGLNEPLYTQFFTWIGKLLHGDLGVSLISNVPVLKMIGQRVEPSISIALSTIILSIADRGAARRDRGVETRHLDRPLRDGIVGGRLLGPGIRDRLCADPDLRHRPALAAGAGFQEHHRGPRRRFSNASSCRPARCPSSMSP